MNALMERSGGSLCDLKQAVVYLRDWADLLPIVEDASFSPHALYKH